MRSSRRPETPHRAAPIAPGGQHFSIAVYTYTRRESPPRLRWLVPASLVPRSEDGVPARTVEGVFRVAARGVSVPVVMPDVAVAPYGLSLRPRVPTPVGGKPGEHLIAAAPFAAKRCHHDTACDQPSPIGVEDDGSCLLTDKYPTTSNAWRVSIPTAPSSIGFVLMLRPLLISRDLEST